MADNASRARTGYEVAIGDTEERIFDYAQDGGHVRGMRIKAGTAALDIRIPELHGTGAVYATIAAGEVENFYWPNLGITEVFVKEETGAAGATATWFPIL